MPKNLEIRARSRELAITKVLSQHNAKEDDLEIEVLENPSKGFLGIIGVKDGVYKITFKENELDISKGFIETIIKNAALEAEVNAVHENNLIRIDISGKDAHRLIGRRGETLDSVQLLTGLALNKINKDSKTRVSIDIGNYRKKRRESLVRYANKMAREVAKTKKTKKLDYMNPYERRIIHSALQNDKYVITYSEGTDPHRRLVIECK
ncbi:MAG: protein jag [Clostridioides sp.]|jgi:spoIIIJ-associated protein|nr:protein jag [Clostridioides sp.]